MSSEQHTEILKAIDKISERQDDLFIADAEWKRMDAEWKARAEPVVKAFENSRWLGGLIITLLKILGVIGAAIGTYKLIKESLLK